MNSFCSISPLPFESSAAPSFLKFKPANELGRDIFTCSFISSIDKTSL